MASCRSFIDRYFTRRYAVDVRKKPMEDICLSFHSNGVSVLTLAPSHPIVRQTGGITIKSIDYKVTEKVDRLDNKVSGKSKRGAQNLAPDAPVCRITCGGETGDQIFTIRACTKGRLIEVNDRLVTEPQLIVTHPETLGYICVIVKKKDWGEGVKQDESLIERPSYLRLRFPQEMMEDMPVRSDPVEDMEDS